MIQLAIVAAGALLIWSIRAKRNGNRNLWRENWDSVFWVALAIGVLIVDRISYSTFKASDVLYALGALAAYSAFVYLWNRHEPRTSPDET